MSANTFPPSLSLSLSHTHTLARGGAIGSLSRPRKKKMLELSLVLHSCQGNDRCSLGHIDVFESEL